MEDLQGQIRGAIEELYGLGDVEVALTIAPVETGADFATNVAMRLAKVLHKAPMVIGAEVLEKISGWEGAVAAPGFLNFYAPDEYFLGILGDLGHKLASGEKIYSSDEYDGKTVICEFSDPNPFKVLHVGHLYTSIVGDSISRLLEGAGAKVVRANFGGDVGLHVAKTLWALQNGEESEQRDLGDESSSLLTIDQIAKAYVQGTRAYEEDEKAHDEITKINAEIYDIALNDKHDSALAEVYWQGRELSYQYFKDFYAKIGVKFDKYYPESTVAQRGLKEVRKGLGEGVYEESDGAVVYKGERVGLHTRVFINKNGLPTYEAKDVGLIFTKWDDYHFDESIVITGNDIIEYMKVVLTSVGEMEAVLPERTRHLTHGQVKLPGNEKMSSRKGNFLKAVDVLEMVANELGGEKADFKVVMAAIKYAFLKYKMGGDIIFDPKDSVSMTGNSGVYLLYSAVRARKILQNLHEEQEVLEAVSQRSEFERRLVKKIAQYVEILQEAVGDKAVNKLCTYLYELAQEFSRFYENVKVAGNDREAELAKVVRIYLGVMEHGLGLLGIEVPEEM